MRAIAFQEAGPITRPGLFEDITLPRPEPSGHDLLVAVHAVSVNPVDTKVRAGMRALAPGWNVLGYDAAGTVVAVGPEVTRFQPGDAVFYAGDISRPGTNAEYHLVDERIVGHKPASLDWCEAAALPLTAITAWETLFERLDVRRAVPGADSLLIIGGAGGVGSMAVQLARQLTDLTVVATASRPETRDWVQALGAHHALDHRQPLDTAWAETGLVAPGFVFSTTHSDLHLAAVAALIAPQGRYALIDDPNSLDAVIFKRKAVSLHWELMFTRPVFQTPDMIEQGRLLDEVARLVDAGTLRTTLTERRGQLSVETLTEAHAQIESGRTRGKIVLDGLVPAP